MRELILLSLLILPITVSAETTTLESFYKSDIEKCDKTSEHDLEFGDLSTMGMRTTMNNQIDCYKKIAHKIIDKNYIKIADDMKKNMDSYISSAAKITWDINQPDDCYPQCGTIVGLNATSASLDAAKRYLELLLTLKEIY